METGQWLSTDNFAQQKRLDFWKDTLANLLTKLECTTKGAGHFRGMLKINSAAPLNLLTVRASGHEISRATQRTGQTGGEQVFVCVQIDGTAVVEQDGRQVQLDPGDLTILDTSRAFLADFPGDMEQLVFQVPRQLLRARVGALERVTATAVSGHNPLGSLTGQLLRSFALEGHSLQPQISRRLGDQAIDMVAIAFMSSLEGAENRPTVARAVLASRGRSHIEANLHDSDLSPTVIADHLGISKRYLSSVFSSDGITVERFIRERRLQKCARDLADPGQAVRSIGDIAFCWGFSNLTHFSQCFKSTFGQPPREYRRQALSEVVNL